MKRREIIALLVGAAATRPLATRAQQRGGPVVGYLSSASAASYPASLLAAFRDGLGETGFVEGDNVAIEYRWADDNYERLPTLVEDLIRKKAAVIAATGGLVSAAAAKRATSTIPIVFTMGDDPVAAGIVESFSRPGKNITGVSFFVVELGTKLLEFAIELVPGDKPIGLLVNPRRPSYEPVRRAIAEAARVKERRLLVVEAGGEEDFEPGFAQLAHDGVGALLITSDPLYLDRRERLMSLAMARLIPTVCAWRSYIPVGALISYGPSLSDAYRKVGVYAGRILKGEKPADLPVQQPTKFELVVNLKSARALGINAPQSLLVRADEVIE